MSKSLKSILFSLCSTGKSGSGGSGCSAPGSPLSGTVMACSISKNGRRPKGHSLPWPSIIFPSPTGFSSMGTNNPGKDSRWETSNWTCAARRLQEGIARTFPETGGGEAKRPDVPRRTGVQSAQAHQGPLHWRKV